MSGKINKTHDKTAKNEPTQISFGTMAVWPMYIRNVYYIKRYRLDSDGPLR